MMQEIQERAEKRRRHAYEELLAYKNSEAYELFRQAEVDVDALLERVEELEAQNEALHTALKASGERREQVEAENERLQRLFSAKPAVSSQPQLPPGFRTSEPRSD